MQQALRTILSIWVAMVVTVFGVTTLGTLATGNVVAFDSNRTGNDEIYLLDVTRHLTINLTQHPAPDRNPTWSPSGRYIAFESVRLVPGFGMRSSIYMLDLEDWRTAWRVMPPFVRGVAPAWSPNGDFLAISGSLQGMPNNDIFVVNARNGTLLRITDTPERYEYSPSWSPDGRMLAYGAYDPNTVSPAAVYVIPFNQTTIQFTAQTTNDPILVSDNFGAGDPSWTPDGKVMMIYDLTAERVFVTEPEADAPDIPLAIPDIQMIEEPRMSYDGGWIVFSSSESPGRLWRSIYRVREDGGGLQRVTHGAERNNTRDSSPEWQPPTPR